MHAGGHGSPSMRADLELAALFGWTGIVVQRGVDVVGETVVGVRAQSACRPYGRWTSWDARPPSMSPEDEPSATRGSVAGRRVDPVRSTGMPFRRTAAVLRRDSARRRPESDRLRPENGWVSTNGSRRSARKRPSPGGYPAPVGRKPRALRRTGIVAWSKGGVLGPDDGAGSSSARSPWTP